MNGILRHWRRLLLAAVGLFALIQLVPYGRAHDNPPPTKQAMLGTAHARQIFTDACADCHSFKTKWPWYTNVAPASWLATNDVKEGRGALNLSAWDTPQPALDEVVEKIQSGEMPPLKYKVMPNHANARLSDKEKAALIGAMRKLYATDPPAAISYARGG